MKTSKKLAVRLCLLSIILINFSCSSDDTAECEMSNQGTVVLDNSANNGTLYVYFNESGRLITGSETIRIAPNEIGSIDYPAGPINVKAFVFFNTLNIGDLVERDIDLGTCETKTIVY